MDATSRRILGLISEMNVRYVVPVYQRPYSWDTEQCERLLEDIVTCGRKRNLAHFTGSIVTIQDGSLSRQGVAPLLLIDGQQRIATINLLLVALARYDRKHPGWAHSFSLDEIARGGFVTNPYRTGDDYYKLTLSKDDRPTLHSLVRNLIDENEPIDKSSRRLLDNLAYFERRLEDVDSIDDVWAGLQRLEVVSISLAQGQDQPQVIFESMNSTGKDLGSADLVRNFVLMSYDIDEQDDVYRVYWSPIERTLGT
ncbi:MAG: DUF262 domain-containing protein, partial [Coriobacteriales bacterium]|nr:DUF262 domain-containing protein [Coriobacteriales bacterium]